MASVHRRELKDGTFVFRVSYLEDKRQRWTPTIVSADGAAEMKGLIERLGPEAALAILRRRSGRDVEQGPPLLRDWLERHLTRLEANATPGTIAEYRRMAARTWLPRLGDVPIDALTEEAIEEWIGWQRRQPTRRGGTYSPKSIANAHGLLSSTLAAAVRAKAIPGNVAHGIDLPDDHERPEMVFLTEGEFVQLHTALPPRWRTLVALLYSTGLRWGEATALTPADLSLDAMPPTVRVTRAWKKGAAGVYLGSPKTRKSRRTVALAPELVPDLRALCDGRASGDLVFTAAQGGRVSGQHFHSRVWRPAIVRAGLTKTPRVHDLRHSHAAAMIARGMDIYELQHRLGHESVKTTGDVYGHLMPDVHVRGSAHSGATLAGAYPQIEA